MQNIKYLMKNFNFTSLTNIDGIGETQINSLKRFFENKSNYSIIEKLSLLLNISDIKF